MHYYYNNWMRSSIFLHAIQHSDNANTITTLQSHVNLYCKEYNTGFLPLTHYAFTALPKAYTRMHRRVSRTSSLLVSNAWIWVLTSSRASLRPPPLTH
jgi:hypothetical protein